ncbi:MAG TPA: DUF2339 domain-containing protein [Candidatus Bathyarchaeia archaeon]|nr:DUF2339 domain-containing protein [Candidatus Bathyarchaeia archaeon]
MASEEELRQLRRDLNEAIARTSEISRRLARLESEAAYPRRQTPAQPVEPTPPPPLIKPRAPEPPWPVSPVYAPPEPRADAAPEGVVARFMRERWEEMQARRRELGWEVLVGTYGLPRIAMVCITIAVVFFLSLAIERWGSQWLPHLRVGIGYAICVGLLVMAWRFERKYAGLARVLYGGGFAVMYFVTFATHYVTFARVFESPAPTLVLLTAVVVAWAVAAQMRRSKVIAVLVTGLGHLTVLLSTVTLDRPAPFAMVGLVFLGVGSAFFLLRNRWYYVAALGVVGCYINDALILSYSKGGNPYVDFWVSMGVLAVFYLTFALAELLAHEEVRRDLVPTWFRSAFVTVNTAGFLVLGTVLVGHFEFTRDHQDLFRFATAAALLLIGLGYLRLRVGDPLFNVYFVKATALATLALATRYGGSTLGVALAIETVVLLISARRSGLVVTRVLAFGVAVIALAYGASMALETHVAYARVDYWTQVLKALLGVLAFLGASQLYQRTDWSKRSPRAIPFAKEFAVVLWQLDLVSERPDGADDVERPVEGLLFPHLYALSGAVLFFCHACALLAEGHRLPALGLFALVLTAAAYLLDSKPFGLASALAMGAAAYAGVLEVTLKHGFAVYAAAGGICALAAVALVSEAGRLGLRRGLDFHQSPVSPYLLYGVVALLTGLALNAQLTAFNCTIALAVAAVAAGLLVFVLHPVAMGWIGLGFLMAACVSCVSWINPASKPWWRLVVAGLVVLLIAADRFYTHYEDRVRVRYIGTAASVVACMIVLLSYYHGEQLGQWFLPAVAGTCFVFCAYGVVLRSPAAFVMGVAAALFASGGVASRSFELETLDTGLVVAFAALAVFWLAAERAFAWSGEKTRQRVIGLLGARVKGLEPDMLLVALWTGLLLEMAYRIPHLMEANRAFITIGWFAVAAGSFLLSLAFKGRYYRYAGLAVIVLSLLRLFLIDMSEQDPLLRVAAFAVVGAGLLAISIGYYKWMARVKAGKREEAGGQ